MSSLWKCLLAIVIACNTMTIIGCGDKTTVVEGKEEDAAEKFPTKQPDKGSGEDAK